MLNRKPPRPLKPATDDEVDEFGHAYAVFAVCQCGHVREIKDGWKVAKEGWLKVEQLRARLRCSKCRGRTPRIEVYRRPRV